MFECFCNGSSFSSIIRSLFVYNPACCELSGPHECIPKDSRPSEKWARKYIQKAIGRARSENVREIRENRDDEKVDPVPPTRYHFLNIPRCIILSRTLIYTSHPPILQILRAQPG